MKKIGRRRIGLVILLGFSALTLFSQNNSNNSLGEEKDIYQNPLIDSLKLTLEKCYLVAIAMQDKEGNVLEGYILAGKDYYEEAYKLFAELQMDLGDDLPRSKGHLISQALKLYSEIYYNKYATNSNYLPKVNYMRENLEKFPYETSEIENEFGLGAFRVNLPRDTRQRINLPSKGNYCLWEMKGGDQIQIEGTLPNNGYGLFNLKKEQLPIYLGGYKKFLITGSYWNMELVFKPCEKN